ncbi:MAG: GDSL-type esterase/lipase family protein [Terrisporobacter sp.]|uniref:GDSL-type esterase/lipase family protein n=1 Tax=Terrisporobacter sp. TaxID=1965305 RepID=UPI002FC76FB6
MSKNICKGGVIINNKKATIISIVSVSILVGVISLNKNVDAINSENKDEEAKVARGIQIIKELENKDVLESEEEIKIVQSSIIPNQENTTTTQKINYIEKFSNSVILGDSRSEGLIEYGILNNSSVIAHKGRNVKSAMGEGDVSRAVNLYPQNIFLTYGMNDVMIYKNSKDFTDQYEKLIEKLQSQLPDSKIYVNSIFRTSNLAKQKKPEFARIDSFNIALQEMCKKLNITYIDGSSCAVDNLFEGDGIHFKPDFNKKWLNLLINKANL